MSDRGGIRQTGSVKYLAVNVYPTSSGWRVAVLVREPGRPYPRLVSRISDVELDVPDNSLPAALEAASAHLATLAGDLAPL